MKRIGLPARGGCGRRGPGAGKRPPGWRAASPRCSTRSTSPVSLADSTASRRSPRSRTRSRPRTSPRRSPPDSVAVGIVLQNEVNSPATPTLGEALVWNDNVHTGTCENGGSESDQWTVEYGAALGKGGVPLPPSEPQAHHRQQRRPHLRPRRPAGVPGDLLLHEAAPDQLLRRFPRAGLRRLRDSTCRRSSRPSSTSSASAWIRPAARPPVRCSRARWRTSPAAD